MCLEGCLPLVAGCNANIRVASMEVKLGVDLGTAQLVEEVCDKWIRYQSSEWSFWGFGSQHRVTGCHPSSWQRRTGAPAGNWDDWMNPCWAYHQRNFHRRTEALCQRVGRCGYDHDPKTGLTLFLPLTHSCCPWYGQYIWAYARSICPPVPMMERGVVSKGWGDKGGRESRHLERGFSVGLRLQKVWVGFRGEKRFIFLPTLTHGNPKNFWPWKFLFSW